MGVDAKFFVRPEANPNNIVEALETLGFTGVEWKPTTVAPEYITIFFDSKMEGWHKRMIHFHFNRKDEYFGMTCNLLSLRSNTESIHLLHTLATMFGGIVQEEDHIDICEMHQVPGAGDFRWLLERFYEQTKPEDVESGFEEQLSSFQTWYHKHFQTV